MRSGMAMSSASMQMTMLALACASPRFRAAATPSSMPRIMQIRGSCPAKSLQYVARAIGRSVVDDEELEFAVRLAAYAVDRCSQIAGRVVDRHQNGDAFAVVVHQRCRACDRSRGNQAIEVKSERLRAW